ncbi:hypothetical protein ACVPOQ_05705 [Staphylococcus aureus]
MLKGKEIYIPFNNDAMESEILGAINLLTGGSYNRYRIHQSIKRARCRFGGNYETW